MCHRAFIALLAEVPLLVPVVSLLYKAEKAVAFVYPLFYIRVYPILILMSVGTKVTLKHTAYLVCNNIYA